MADLKSELKRVKQALAVGPGAGAKQGSAAAKASGMPNARQAKHQVATNPVNAPLLTRKVNSTTVKSSAVAVSDAVQATGTSVEPLLPGLPKPQVLTRQAEYKSPPQWLARGKSTQLTDRPSGRAIEVFVGLDFGTAYTKVAVGLLDKVFVVDWNGILDLPSRYLLPSEYSTLTGGRCYLGQHPNANVAGLVSDLKQPFISGNVPDACICRAAVYLALVLQYVRAWIYERHGPKIAASPLRWHLNIGIPSDGLEEDDRTAAYRRLSWVAWTLSLRESSEINCDQADQLLGQVTDKLPVDLVETDPVPEFVAQLAGYAQSAQRHDGLHALVDIGGGTVDMVTFNVHHADGDDVFPFFVPRVEPLGTHGMLANRFHSLKAHEKSLRVALDDLVEAEKFASAMGTSVAEIHALDTTFSKTVASKLAAVLHETKRRRYRLAPEWQQGIRTFFTGGGASLSVYRVALEQCRTPGNCKLLQSHLPVHPKLDDFEAPVEEYHRFSVACGLATNSISLGKIVCANQVEDDRPVTEAVAERDRLRHEDLYSP